MGNFLAQVLSARPAAAARPRLTQLLSSHSIWVLSALIAVGAALRLYLLADKSLWLDEAFSFFLGQRSLGDLLHMVVETDVHPPLYYMLLRIWLLLGESAGHLRLLSAIIGIASIPLMYLLASWLFDRVEAGLIAAAILALSPFHIWYAQETRMYALLMLFVLASAAFFIRALRSGSTRDWVAYSLTTTLALYTDYAAIWYVVAILVFFLISWRHFPGRIKPFLLSQAAILLLYVPWLPYLFRQLTQVTENFWLPPPTFQTLLGVFLDFNSLNFPWMAVSVLYMTLILVWAYIVPDEGWPRRLATAWLFIPLAVSLLLSLRQPLFLSRNLIVASIGYYLIVVGTIIRFDSLKATAALLLPLLAMNLVSIGQNAWFEEKQNWRELAAHVTRLAEDTEEGLVIFIPPYAELPFAYYAEQQDLSLATQGYPQNELLRHPDPDTVSSLNTLLNERPYVWLVLIDGELTDTDWRVKEWLDSHGYVRGEDFVQGDISVLSYARWDTIAAGRSPASTSADDAAEAGTYYLPILFRQAAEEPPATVHIVESGDTMAAIARRYGTTVEALVEANNIPNSNRIRAGQVLIVP